MNDPPTQREATLRTPPSPAKSHRVHFSSRTAEWATPDSLFEALDAEFGFTLDPCATTQNAKCRKFYTAQEDGLRQHWSGHVVFMNPPYGRAIGAWMRKAFESFKGGATVVCLVPARTDTAWWHEYAMKGEIRFLRGRLQFKGAKHAAPFPSAVVVFRNLPVAVQQRNGAPMAATQSDQLQVIAAAVLATLKRCERLFGRHCQPGKEDYTHEMVEASPASAKDSS